MALLALLYGIASTTTTTLPTHQREMDIDNCFWNLDKHGVLKAVRKVAGRVRWGRKVKGDLWFSIAKGGDKTVDHMGKGSESSHRTVNLEDVLNFVEWDVFHNTDFVFGSLVLAQGDKGVPIGGFLSAQLCVLWGIFRELLLFDDEVEEKRRGCTDSFSEIIDVVEKKVNNDRIPQLPYQDDAGERISLKPTTSANKGPSLENCDREDNARHLAALSLRDMLSNLISFIDSRCTLINVHVGMCSASENMPYNRNWIELSEQCLIEIPSPLSTRAAKEAKALRLALQSANYIESFE